MQSTAEELSPATECADDEEDEIKRSSQRSLYRRDGCRAWLVCLSAVLSNFLIFGCTQTFGVIFPVLLDEFNEGKAKTAWVGSLASSLSMTLSPIAAKLIHRFGPRPVSIAGGIVSALSLFLTSFTTSIAFMYCTYGIIFGIGSSMAYTSTFDVVPKYFKKRLALAVGMMHAGTGASFGMSSVIETIISHMGWRNTYKVISGMALLVCICGLSFSPHVEKDIEPSDRRMTEQGGRRRTSLLRNRPFVICCIYSLVYQCGNNIPLTHLGRHVQESGLTPSQAANLYIGYGISTMTGRVVAGRICDLKFVNSMYVCGFVFFVIGIALMLIQFSKDFLGFMLCFCVHGVCDGMQVTATGMIIMQNTHALDRTLGYGWFLVIASFGILIGAPFGGFIADQLGSYIPAFYLAGSFVLLSAILVMTLKCFSKPGKYAKAPCTEVILEPLAVEKRDTIVIERITTV